jgi:NADH-quinone oxidoreductase subunit M
MNQLGFPLLSLVIFLPLCGVVVMLFLRKDTVIKWWALVVTVANFLISLPLYFTFQSGTAKMQFVEHIPWMPDLGVSYHLGIDGISLFLVLLTTFLTPIAVLSSWTYITDKVKEYMIFMLFMETSMVGVFAALDLILFYVFWEATLVPMYFLIGIWGGERRIYAAVKFFLYTLAGSALMLVAIFVLYFMNAQATGQPTFDLLELQKFGVPLAAQTWLFLAFALGFAIKVPLFPFHTWLPDAHVQAPTAGSVILAGVLLKMGAYGFIRFCLPLFPAAFAYFVPLMSILAIIGIIYGSLVAFRQSDVKSLVAYSSVAHLGFVVLGIFALNAQGLSGGVLQMVNHGLSTGALFLLVGMLYERRHTRLMDDFGGLWKQLPLFGIFLLIVTLSSIGLPGLNGFIGEFTILVGTFQANWIYAALAATGIVLGAWYMLTMFRRVMHGPLDKPVNRQLQDLSAREIIVLVPVVVLIFLIGLFPNLFFDKIQFSVDNLLSQTSITISMGEPGSQ